MFSFLNTILLFIEVVQCRALAKSLAKKLRVKKDLASKLPKVETRL